MMTMMMNQFHTNKFVKTKGVLSGNNFIELPLVTSYGNAFLETITEEVGEFELSDNGAMGSDILDTDGLSVCLDIDTQCVESHSPFMIGDLDGNNNNNNNKLSNNNFNNHLRSSIGSINQQLTTNATGLYSNIHDNKTGQDSSWTLTLPADESNKTYCITPRPVKPELGIRAAVQQCQFGQYSHHNQTRPQLVQFYQPHFPSLSQQLTNDYVINQNKKLLNQINKSHQHEYMNNIQPNTTATNGDADEGEEDDDSSHYYQTFDSTISQSNNNNNNNNNGNDNIWNITSSTTFTNHNQNKTNTKWTNTTTGEEEEEDLLILSPDLNQQQLIWTLSTNQSKLDEYNSSSYINSNVNQPILKQINTQPILCNDNKLSQPYQHFDKYINQNYTQKINNNNNNVNLLKNSNIPLITDKQQQRQQQENCVPSMQNMCFQIDRQENLSPYSSIYQNYESLHDDSINYSQLTNYFGQINNNNNNNTTHLSTFMPKSNNNNNNNCFVNKNNQKQSIFSSPSQNDHLTYIPKSSSNIYTNLTVPKKFGITETHKSITKQQTYSPKALTDNSNIYNTKNDNINNNNYHQHHHQSHFSTTKQIPSGIHIQSVMNSGHILKPQQYKSNNNNNNSLLMQNESNTRNQSESNIYYNSINSKPQLKQVCSNEHLTTNNITTTTTNTNSSSSSSGISLHTSTKLKQQQQSQLDLIDVKSKRARFNNLLSNLFGDKQSRLIRSEQNTSTTYTTNTNTTTANITDLINSNYDKPMNNYFTILTDNESIIFDHKLTKSGYGNHNPNHGLQNKIVQNKNKDDDYNNNLLIPKPALRPLHRSPAVLGVSDLFVKTDDELTQLLKESDQLGKVKRIRMDSLTPNANETSSDKANRYSCTSIQEDISPARRRFFPHYLTRELHLNWSNNFEKDEDDVDRRSFYDYGCDEEEDDDEDDEVDVDVGEQLDEDEVNDATKLIAAKLRYPYPRPNYPYANVTNIMQSIKQLNSNNQTYQWRDDCGQDEVEDVFEQKSPEHITPYYEEVLISESLYERENFPFIDCDAYSTENLDAKRFLIQPKMADLEEVTLSSNNNSNRNSYISNSEYNIFDSKLTSPTHTKQFQQHQQQQQHVIRKPNSDLLIKPVKRIQQIRKRRDYHSHDSGTHYRTSLKDRLPHKFWFQSLCGCVRSSRSK